MYLTPSVNSYIYSKFKVLNPTCQRFSTGMPQEFLKHGVPDYLARGTDGFSLRLPNKTMTTANTIAVCCD